MQPRFRRTPQVNVVRQMVLPGRTSGLRRVSHVAQATPLQARCSARLNCRRTARACFGAPQTRARGGAYFAHAGSFFKSSIWKNRPSPWEIRTFRRHVEVNIAALRAHLCGRPNGAAGLVRETPRPKTEGGDSGNHLSNTSLTQVFFKVVNNATIYADP